MESEQHHVQGSLRARQRLHPRSLHAPGAPAHGLHLHVDPLSPRFEWLTFNYTHAIAI